MQDVVAGDQVRTFLIADVRGYTRYTLEHGDAAAARLAARFGEICRDVTEAHGGDLIELRGDEALAVFVSTRAALLAAGALQERLGDETRADPTTPLRVGIGLDAGEAIPVGGGYRGAALNLAARLCSLAGPGEVLASEAVTHLARRVEGLAYVDRAEVELKGFAEPVRVFAVRTDHGVGTPEVTADEAEAGAGTPAPLPIGGFLGSLPRAPLAAREDECARLLASVDTVARGEGRLLMLAGEPGVGKTGEALEAEEGKGRRGGPTRSALIAWHFLQADDDRALTYAVQAGDEAEQVYAHGEAGAQYRIALELARERGERTLEAEILGKLAAALHEAARYEDAVAPADQAATAYRALSDDEGERRAAAVLVRCLTRLGRYDEAARRLERLLTDDAPFTRGTLELCRAEASLLFSRARYSEFADSVLKQREIAQVLGDDLSIAQAAQSHALASRVQGRVRESIPAFEAALPLAERAADRTLLTTLLHNLADAYLEIGNVQRALAIWERAVEGAGSYGDPAQTGFVVAWRGYALTIQGRWDEARTACEQGLAMFDDIGESSWFATYPVLFLADLDQYQGRPEAAGRLQDALRMALDHHDEQSLYYLADLVAREAVLRDPASTWPTMVQIIASARDLDSPIWLPTFLIHSARVQTEMGEAQGALHTLKACLSSHVLELPRYRIPALRNLGVAQTRLGAFAAAETAFAEALEHARAIPWPFAEATIHFEWGLLERAHGREDVAVRRLEEALTLFRSLGAEPYAQLAKASLSA